MINAEALKAIFTTKIGNLKKLAQYTGANMLLQFQTVLRHFMQLVLNE